MRSEFPPACFLRIIPHSNFIYTQFETELTPKHIKACIGWPQPPSSPIMKGKTKAREPPAQPAPPDDGTDNIVGRYTVFDLEGIVHPSQINRYTIAELAQRLLILAIFESEFSYIPVSFFLLISGKQQTPAFLRLFASIAFRWLLVVRALQVQRTTLV